MIVREPNFINWYPDKRAEIEKYFETPKEKIARAFSFILSPHAGWSYSGKIAGSAYSHLQAIDTAIVLGTNHTGLGSPSSLFSKGCWETPFGRIGVDEGFASLLLDSSKELKADSEAHLYEHAIEVQIPFLQFINPDIKIVPIEMMDYRWEVCRDIAAALAKSLEKLQKQATQKKFAVIASTDMSHCGEQYGQIPPDAVSADAFARAQDRIAIDQILSLDGEKLLEVVKEHRITMCGSGPAATVLLTAKLLGARNAQLTGYGTSTEITGEKSNFSVGYAGMAIS